MLVRLDDGAIDAMCKSKIVSIDDEAAHAKSLAGARKRTRNYEGLPMFSEENNSMGLTSNRDEV